MNKFGSLATFFGIGLIALNSSIYTVDPGEKALIMDKLKGTKTKCIWPRISSFDSWNSSIQFNITKSPVIYDCRLKPTDIHVVTGTKDLQTVTISLRILQQPIAEHLPTIHQLLGRDYEKKNIQLNWAGSFENHCGSMQYFMLQKDDADQLLKYRENISKQIKKLLFEKAQSFNVNVEDVSFMNLGFSREYAKAVQRRAVQQQLAERQKFIVLRDEELKTAQIIRSEAEAEAAKLINTSVKLYGSTQIQIKKLQAARNIATVLAKNPNVSFVPSGNTGNLLNLRV